MPDLIFQITNVLGVILRLLGAAVFGVALGWFTMKIYERKEMPAYYQAVLLVVFFGFFAAMFWGLAPGALGALALGTSITMLVIGLRKPKVEATEKPVLEKPTRRKTG